MIIFLCGGGTAGSVTPLLAVAEHLHEHEVHFVGTAGGVERKLIPNTIVYHAIAAGKLRRYWSWRNVVDLFFLIVAFFQSLWLVARYQPQVVVSMGSFVSVPLAWAAWWCGVPVVIHQQDLHVGLTTRLLKPIARSITKAFEETPLRAETIGNPVRNLTPTTQTIRLDPQYKTVLILGGGTGAQAINTAVTEKLCAIANIIHCTGEGRGGRIIQHPRYHSFTFLKDEMAEAFHAADIVVCRAGLGTLSELAALGKTALVIPIPHSSQEANAAFFERHHACVVLPQSELTPDRFRSDVEKLFNDADRRKRMQTAVAKLNPHHAARVLAERILVMSQPHNG